jgi:hypothetical protein
MENPTQQWRKKLTHAMLRRLLFLVFVLFLLIAPLLGQTNPHHVRVSGYTRSDGTYVQPYFRTAPNSTNTDNFSTKGNVNPYNGKPGWVDPDSKYNTFYYDTYTYQPNDGRSNNTSSSTLPLSNSSRTYIQDEHGNYTSYLTVKDERTYNIFDISDKLILYLVVNHRGDWRIFDNNWIYIKTIFVTTEQ